jgi:hypothetical protein
MLMMMCWQRILELFGDASGRRTNLHKCVAYPVSYANLDLNVVLEGFGGAHPMSIPRMGGSSMSARAAAAPTQMFILLLIVLLKTYLPPLNFFHP